MFESKGEVLLFNGRSYPVVVCYFCHSFSSSLSTCICLHYKPPVVALAMLHLAAKLSKQSMQNFTPVPRQDWWRHFSPEIEQSVLDGKIKRFSFE